ncbi:MAG: hypothetical protein NTW42_10310, partial [Deltaproteobacteria bacterium]|nr:hypothetical protein [Deltaproteobacteria bacterium]
MLFADVAEVYHLELARKGKRTDVRWVYPRKNGIYSMMGVVVQLYSAAIRKALAPGIVKGGWVCYDARKEQGAMRPRATKAEWNF